MPLHSTCTKLAPNLHQTPAPSLSCRLTAILQRKAGHHVGLGLDWDQIRTNCAHLTRESETGRTCDNANS